MSESGFNLVELEGLEGEEIPQELLDELDRELARNAEANRLAKEREKEAMAARERAEHSKRQMQDMMKRYEDIRTKVEKTRQTLQESAAQVERRAKIRRDIEDLKSRAEKAHQEYRQKQLEQEGISNETVSTEQDSSSSQQPPQQQPQQQQQASVVQQPGRRKDYAQTVQRLQEKLKMKRELQVKNKEEEEGQEETTVEVSAAAEVLKELEEEEIPKKPESKEEVQAAIRIMEAKCANVQSKLDEIHMNEELLATREAQLAAAKKQKAAMEAEQEARKKEEEAKEMRLKVESMMKLLSERKSKLKVTEVAIEKKGNVVDKVTKILHCKERKASYTEKKRADRLLVAKERLMFAPVPEPVQEAPAEKVEELKETKGVTEESSSDQQQSTTSSDESTTPTEAEKPKEQQQL